MRKLILGLLFLLFGSSIYAQVTRFEMFFDLKQVELSCEQKQQIDSLALFIKYGERLMIYPLTEDPISNRLIFAREAKTQAAKVAAYAKTIGFDLLGTPSNFPSPYTGLSVCTNMKLNKAPSLVLETPAQKPKGLEDHYPPKASQFFVIDPNKDTLIVGAEGTELFFKAGSLFSKKKVKVELKEFYDMQDYMKNGLPTVSNGRMIETGGSIYLNATENDLASKEVKINQSIGVDVGFTLGQSDADMQIFIKDPRSPNKLNWILPPKTIEKRSWKMVETVKDYQGNIISQKTFNSEMEWEAYLAEQERLKEIEEKERAEQREKDRLIQEALMKEMEKQEKARQKMANTLNVLDMGYINCDKFYREPMIPFFVSADVSIEAEYYLVYKDVRGLMRGNVINNKVTFGQVPENRQASLIAVSFIDDQAYYYESSISVNSRVKPIVKLKAVEESFINQQLAMLK